MKTLEDREVIPLGEAALRLGLNRERLLRRIQSREIEGFQREDGRWVVPVDAISSARERRGGADVGNRRRRS